MTLLSDFLSSFLNRLNDRDISYIIERNYEHLSGSNNNNVGFLIHKNHQEQFLTIAANIAKELQLNIILLEAVYGDGRLYLFRCLSDCNCEIIRIDYKTKIHYFGIQLLNTEALINSRKNFDGFFVPSKGAKAAISLIEPLMLNGKVSDDYKDIMHSGVSDDKETFEKCFRPHLGNDTINFLANSVSMKNYNMLNSSRDELLTTYTEQRFFHSVLGFIRYRTGYFHKLFNPSGIFITISGADTIGKSFAINKASESLKIIYPQERFVKLLLRPGILPQLRLPMRGSGLEKEAESVMPDSMLIAFLKWFYYLLDYILGYYLKILPLKIKINAVIINTYYYDIIIDPVRYGLTLPKWLIKGILPIIPKPDLAIYFDNKPVGLYKCKQKLSPCELNRHVNEWSELVKTIPHAKIITTEKTMEDIVNDVVMLVLKRQSEITKKH